MTFVPGILLGQPWGSFFRPQAVPMKLSALVIIMQGPAGVKQNYFLFILLDAIINNNCGIFGVKQTGAEFSLIVSITVGG